MVRGGGVSRGTNKFRLLLEWPLALVGRVLPKRQFIKLFTGSFATIISSLNLHLQVTKMFGKQCLSMQVENFVTELA